MPTPKKKYPYNFIYEDGSYMSFDLTHDEYDSVRKAMYGQDIVATSVALIHTKGLRFVVELKEPEYVATPDADPVLDEAEAQYLEYLRQGE